MSKNNFQNKKLEIPDEFEGIQINFCKNSKCQNFGVHAEKPAEQENDGSNSKGQCHSYSPIYRLTTSSKKSLI